MSRQGIGRWIGRFVLSFAAGGLVWGLTACSKVSAPQGSVSAADPNGIIGGEPVLDQDPIAASTVAILNRRANQIVCTGSLITPQLVVTAAHCTTETPGDLAIVFTRQIPKSRRDLAALPTRSVIAGETHSQWPKNTFENEKEWGDIALLRFEGDLPATFSPARLLNDAQLLKKDETSILAGFGWTDGRRRTPAEGLNKTQVKIEDPLFSNSEILLNQSQGTGACHGDSGGPAFLMVNGVPLLLGVTSRGHDDPSDTCEHFSIYTSLLAHANWIKQASADLFQPDAIGRKIPQPF